MVSDERFLVKLAEVPSDEQHVMAAPTSSKTGWLGSRYMRILRSFAATYKKQQQVVSPLGVQGEGNLHREAATSATTPSTTTATTSNIRLNIS